MERYLSAKEGSILTINFPAISSFCASSIEAAIDAPEDIPIGIPSNFAIFRAVAKAVSFAILITSSTISVFKLSGTKPAPIPCILWDPGLPPERTELSSGSTATTLKVGFLD